MVVGLLGGSGLHVANLVMALHSARDIAPTLLVVGRAQATPPRLEIVILIAVNVS